jgi:hypothetical protein
VRPLAALLLAAAALAPTSAAGRTYHAKHVVIQRPPLIVGGPLHPLPRVPTKPEEDEGLEAPPETGAATIDPGPETTVMPVPDGGFPVAGDPFAVPQVTDLGDLSARDDLAEPSQASAGKVVWYTGNSGAAFSLDGGETFKGVDPRRMFPEGSNAFCCDQVVLYAPQINRFVWLIQYWCERRDVRCDDVGSENLQRLAVASPQAIARNRRDPAAAWTQWVITPRDVGMKHAWLDYPDLGLGRHSLYLTSNSFSGPDFAGNLVGRIGLHDLKAGGALGLDYIVDRGYSYKPAQNTGTTGFLASNDDPDRLRTLSWPEGSRTLVSHATRHTVDATLGYRTLADGVNWGDRTDPRITGATRRGTELWFAWSEGRSACTARCEGRHARIERLWPQPHVHVVTVDAGSFRLLGERFIHNSSYAIAYPTLATDGNGQVGMTFSFGGGAAGNPSPAAGYLTGGEAFRQIAESPAPGEQGDFFSLHPAWPDTTQLTASGYVSDGAGGSRWLFYRFTRSG